MWYLGRLGILSEVPIKETVYAVNTKYLSPNIRHPSHYGNHAITPN